MTAGIAEIRARVLAAPDQTRSAERGALSGLLLSTPMIVLMLALLLYPLIRLVTIAAGGPSGLGNIIAFFHSAARTRVMLVTFVDSAVVALLCVVVGAIVAWSLRSGTNRIMRGLLWAALLLPFLMGTVTKLYSLTVVLQSNGLVNRTLIAIGLTDKPLGLLYNNLSIVIGMTYQMLPYAVLPLLAGFLSINLDLVQAAEGLGARRLSALATTVLPLSLPSLLASFTVVYIICVGFFLTPVLLGGATAPFTASLISSDVFEFYDVTSAAVSALVLLLSSLVIIAIAYAVVGKERLAKAVST
jgi:ABC-type spermidine/putrescine transport system permease subunit I